MTNRIPLCIAALVLFGVQLRAQTPARLPAPVAAVDTAFDRYTVMIPMRDGVRLNTEIFVPRRAGERLPMLLVRTPYGVGESVIEAVAPGKAMHELARDGYVIVAQDLRGRHKSEGQFVMLRAPRDPKVKGAIDEASDAYDTVDWLVKNVPRNNGRVGIMGVSYGGWTAAMALLDPHPALRAASPQASPADMFLGDDFHHNGAFRLSYGFEYAAMMETSKGQDHFAFDVYDTYDWYLKLGPLSNANAKYLKAKIPTWNNFIAHHSYDDFWKQQTIIPYLTKPLTVPTLNVAGWWDQEDFYGPSPFTRRSRSRTARTGISWSSGRGTTAAGTGARGRHWERSTSARQHPSTFASAYRRRSSAANSRIVAMRNSRRPSPLTLARGSGARTLRGRLRKECRAERCISGQMVR